MLPTVYFSTGHIGRLSRQNDVILSGNKESIETNRKVFYRSQIES